MIQGVGAYGLGWNPQVDILSKHFTCLTFDNRGIGESQPAGVSLTVEPNRGQQVRDTALALQQLSKIHPSTRAEAPDESSSPAMLWCSRAYQY